MWTMAEIKAIAYTPRWYQHPLVLPVAAILVGMFWLFNFRLGMTAPLSIVLLAQIVLFLLLLKRPVWAMAALIVGQLTACNYMTTLPGGMVISIRFLWTILALFLLVPIIRSKGGIDYFRLYLHTRHPPLPMENRKKRSPAKHLCRENFWRNCSRRGPV